MDVSVILITCNKLTELCKTLSHLERFRSRYAEVILIDNGSTDGTAATVRHRFPFVRLLRLPSNYGVPEARNIGAVNARGEILLFLDDDIRYDFAGFDEILRAFREDPGLAVVALDLVNIPVKDLGEVELFDDAGGQVRNDTFELQQQNSFSGGACLIRRHVFRRVGMYPGYFFYSAEERDLSCRLASEGYRIARMCGATAIHKKLITPQTDKRTYYYRYRNRLFVVWRSLPATPAVRATALTVAAGFVASVAAGALGAYLRGIGSAVVRLPLLYMRERRPMTHADYKRYLVAGTWRNGWGGQLSGFLGHIKRRSQ